MAVSDFTFTRTENVKCKSNSAEDFIEYMRKCITKTPKVISHIKQWNPNAFLIGFKFEVGVSYDTLKALAQESIEKNGCDLVMTNDKVEMTTKKSHVGHFFFSTNMHSRGFTDRTIDGKSQIAQEINYILQVID
jgi:phosphopantothenoylcysteine synthetase/decarboxylase